MMKIILKLLFATLIMVFSQVCSANLLYFYDETGNVSSVLDTGNGTTDRPILYLASTGNPVAYVDINNAVYTFSGKHIGWYYDNILWDNYGKIVAFEEISKPDVVSADLIPRTIVIRSTTIPETVTPLDVVTAAPPYDYQLSTTPLNVLVIP